MILWNTGLVETITPSSLDGRETWRITHYPQDPAANSVNDYDLYDLDQATLAPLRSVMNNEQFHLELIFTERQVSLRRTAGQDTAIEQIPLSAAVRPEGPGLDVFIAGLPLAAGYKTRYQIVDRWGGHAGSRVKNVTLSVSNKISRSTRLGKCEIFDLLITPDDGSFRIREEVLAQGPHFPILVEYTRDGKTYPSNEVVALVSRM